MNKLLLLLIALTFSLGAVSASQDHAFVCAGKFSYFPKKVLDVEVNSAILKLDNKQVLLSGIVAFAPQTETVYQIIDRSDVNIRFISVVDKNYSGSINRYTGKLELVGQEGSDKNYVTHHFVGKCSLQKRMF